MDAPNTHHALDASGNDAPAPPHHHQHAPPPMPGYGQAAPYPPFAPPYARLGQQYPFMSAPVPFHPNGVQLHQFPAGQNAPHLPYYGQYPAAFQPLFMQHAQQAVAPVLRHAQQQSNFAAQPPQYIAPVPTAPVVPPSTVATKARALAPRPNPEPRPGVFSYQVDVISANLRREFRGETDMAYKEFLLRSCALLPDAQDDIQLVYKITSEAGKPAPLENETTFATVMARLCQKAKTARSRAVGLEVRNGAKRPPDSKGKKRSREDDIPPAISSDEASVSGNPTPREAYKLLQARTYCSQHDRHCLVSRTAGQQTHDPLDHNDMEQWSTEWSLGRASLWVPPNKLQFDRQRQNFGPNKKPRQSGPETPPIHLTIQNNITTPHPELKGETQPSPESSSYTIGTGIPATVLPPYYSEESKPSIDVSSSASLPTSSDAPSMFSQLFSGENLELGSPVTTLMEKIHAEIPGAGVDELIPFVVEAGFTAASMLLEIPESALAIIGNMGPMRARVLQNYAQCNVHPLLGLRGNYSKPVIFSPVASGSGGNGGSSGIDTSVIDLTEEEYEVYEEEEEDYDEGEDEDEEDEDEDDQLDRDSDA